MSSSQKCSHFAKVSLCSSAVELETKPISELQNLGPKHAVVGQWEWAQGTVSV